MKRKHFDSIHRKERPCFESYTLYTMNDEDQKSVSVLVLTFNNFEFIEKCLDSIRNQRGNLIYEIVVWDNGSTDQTVREVNRVTKDWKIHVKVLAQSENHYLSGSQFVLEALTACSSKYVAIMDGDDEWISDTKLLHQVQALVDNPQVYLVATRAEWFDVQKNEVTTIVPNIQLIGLTESHLLSESNFICNSSVLLRSDMISRIPDDYKYMPIKDYPLWAWGTSDSQILTLADITTRYNFNHGSNISQRKDVMDRFLDVVFTKVAIARRIPSYPQRKKWFIEIGKDVSHYFAKINPIEMTLTKRDELTQQRDELTQQRDELTQQRDELTQQRDELINSTIWKLTTPLRIAINFLKK
jgi:glycosyltransferase involved in cell wall biosynthesis